MGAGINTGRTRPIPPLDEAPHLRQNEQSGRNDPVVALESADQNMPLDGHWWRSARPTTTLFSSLLGRNGSPVDIAKTVAFLLGDDASFITGASIVVDGGYTGVDYFMHKENESLH